jgi:DNA-binding beta-propeller fold protein YncE
MAGHVALLSPAADSRKSPSPTERYSSCGQARGEAMTILRIIPLAACAAVLVLLMAGGAVAPSAVGSAGHTHASPGAPPRSGGTIRTNIVAVSSISARCAVKSSPTFDAYDPVNHYVYVSSLAGYVTILNTSLSGGACHVKANVKLPSNSEPEGLAFDPSDGLMYVADAHLNQIYILNGTSLKYTISNTSCAASFFGCSFYTPWALAYDPDDGVMYVTDQGSGSVTGLAPNDAYRLDFTFSIGGVSPSGIAYSPFDDQMMVSDYGSGELSVFTGYSSSSPAVSNTPVGSNPYGIAYDPYIAGALANAGTAYVVNYGSSNVTVTCAICAGGVDSIAVGTGPIAEAFDEANLHMYVTSYVSHTVSIIGGYYGSVLKTISLPVGSYPAGITYDEYTNNLFVVGFGTGTVYVVS